MDIIARFKIETNKEYTFQDALEIIATEESIGIESIAFEDKLRIYPSISNIDPSILELHKANFSIISQDTDNSGIVDFYFPLDNIIQDFGIISSLFTTILGDLFGIDVVENIYLMEVIYPKEFIANFKGPKFGVSGIKELLNVTYPLLGVIIKPNLGLSPKENGDIVYKLAKSGVNFIKDDELLNSTKKSNIFERLKYAIDAIERATGDSKNVLYGLNITSDSKAPLELAEKSIELGANCLMLNLFVTGFDILKDLSSNPKINVPIHTHRCMHDFFTSNKNKGVSLAFFAELSRLCGADFFHVGTVIGKQNMYDKNNILNATKSLLNSMHNIKQTIPISSRNSPLSIKPTLEFLSQKEIMFLSCGAIYKNPLGIEKSVKALRESINFHAHGINELSEDYQNTVNFLNELRSKII